jgi:hypothetical protein
VGPVDLFDDETVHRVGTELGLDIDWFLLFTADVVDGGLRCVRAIGVVLVS